MPAAPIPPTEAERLAALRSYDVLDTAPEEAFDDLTRLAARLTASPVALISLLDADRIWAKAVHGIAIEEAPRDVAFCAHAILDPSKPLVVADTAHDTRFADNPLVRGVPWLRAYLGVPLLCTEGHALGTLCVFDHRPRDYDEAAIGTMRSLARAVSANLDLRRALRRMTSMALSDPLTNLPNRRALMDSLEASLAGDGTLAAITIDLDHFKETNDAHGHAAGDALLRATAERLRGSLRPGDMVGRLGGDEFLVLLHGVGAEGALRAAQRLQAALQQPVEHAGQMLRLAASMGLALAPEHARTAAGLVRASDEAMLDVKRRSRGGIGRAHPGDDRRLAREAAMLHALKRVAEAGSPALTAHLQPMVCASTNVVHGVEALARWTDAALGPVPPDEMFAVASRAGLAARLSSLARGVALRAHARLRQEGLSIGRLAINLSAAELLREDVVDRLEEQVDEAGLDLGSISVEITEDALLDRVAHGTLTRLAALRGRGARLGLDDFGTGTSGLAQLLSLPLDEIKLDRSFTRKLGQDGRAERIVEGTIRLAHSMELSVVAEGVENEAQARALRNLGCDHLQGWLIAKPMPEAELRVWLFSRQVGGPGIVVPLRGRAAGG